MPMPPSWVMRLPKGLREQPAWVFIGFMVALVGLGFATGLATSAVYLSIGGIGLKFWGGFLTLTGTLTMYATVRAKPALEKMSLRWLAFALLAYTLWLSMNIPITVGAMTYMLATVLIGMAEIRVGHLKILLKVIDTEMKQEGDS